VDLTLTSLFEYLHVVSAIAVITGIAGRNLTMGQVPRSKTVAEVRALARLAGVFDVWLVRPFSLLVLVLGLITAWRAGWPIFGLIEGASTDWLLASLIIYASVIALVPLVFIPRGKLFDEALTSTSTEGAVTSELVAAVKDPAIFAAHAYEMIAAGVIVFLMVTKPF
jgi:uncharacterized membrane protein